MKERCYKCCKKVEGEKLGDDDCKYTLYQCKDCKIKWTRLGH